MANHYDLNGLSSLHQKLLALCVVLLTGPNAPAEAAAPVNAVGIAHGPAASRPHDKAVYEVFDAFGSTDTEAYDINNSGDVVGFYLDRGRYRGFVRKPDGHITSKKDPPGSVNTYAYGIDDEGNVAGFFFDGTRFHGYINRIKFDPKGSTATFAYVIFEGTIPGSFLDKAGRYHGYVRYPDGTITTYDAEGATDTYVTDFANGSVVGYFFDGSTTQCVVWHKRKVTTFHVDGSTDTECDSVNPNGKISGVYADDAGHHHGFVWNRGTIKTFDVPGAVETYPNANHGKNGTIAGNWIDANNKHYAFIRTPAGKIRTYDLKGASWTNGIDINNNNEVTGFYYDGNNNAHGYVRLP